MSVLIKGVKVPKNCHECKFKWWTHSALKGSWFCPLRRKFISTVVITQGKRYSDCPLVEIPPHSRLIDADELIKNCEIWKEPEIKDEHDDVWNRGIDACINEIKHHAPTVIESEGE